MPNPNAKAAPIVDQAEYLDREVSYDTKRPEPTLVEGTPVNTLDTILKNEED